MNLDPSPAEKSPGHYSRQANIRQARLTSTNSKLENVTNFLLCKIALTSFIMMAKAT